ncbi:MAG: metallophosphoesterase, partial [Chloroflexi bacterium]
MKIAVLADIHANFEALQTVAGHVERWQPDYVAVAGDVVNRGPRSPECLRFVQHKQHADGWQVVRGNHEDYVIQWDSPDAATSGPKFEIFKLAYWTFEQLNGNVDALRAMPFQLSLPAPDGSEFRVVHASMINNRTGIFPFTTDEKLRQKITAPNQPPPAVLAVGHTHIPLVRHIDGTLVVNAGSVGLPFDGDTRAAYAQLTWRQGRWAAKIIRLDYDRDRAEQDYVK